MLRHAYTNNNKYYVNAGYLPSIATGKKFNMAEIGKEALAFMGFSANVPTDLNWKNDNEISFDNDYLMPNPNDRIAWSARMPLRYTLHWPHRVTMGAS